MRRGKTQTPFLLVFNKRSFNTVFILNTDIFPIHHKTFKDVTNNYLAGEKQETRELKIQEATRNH
jgi:hypothetical protein